MGVDCQGFLAAICPTLKKNIPPIKFFIVNYIYSGDLKKDNRNNCKYDYYKHNFFCSVKHKESCDMYTVHV